MDLISELIEMIQDCCWSRPITWSLNNCMPFLEIFPCSFGESTPSTIVPNYQCISLSYYSTVNILLFHFPSPAILVICQPGATTANLSRSLSVRWADTPSHAQPQTWNSNCYYFYCFSVVSFVHPFVTLYIVTIWFLFPFPLLFWLPCSIKLMYYYLKQ